VIAARAELLAELLRADGNKGCALAAENIAVEIRRAIAL
jgi:hypothetical protein